MRILEVRNSYKNLIIYFNIKQRDYEFDETDILSVQVIRAQWLKETRNFFWQTRKEFFLI